MKNFDLYKQVPRLQVSRYEKKYEDGELKGRKKFYMEYMGSCYGVSLTFLTAFILIGLISYLTQ